MVIHVFPKDFMHVYFLSFLRWVSYFFSKEIQSENHLINDTYS